MNHHPQSFQSLALIPICVAINLAVGSIAKVLSLPLYVDSIGTVVATLILGWKQGALVGVLGFILMSVLGINPFAVYFSLTQVCIALGIHILGRFGFFRTWLRTLISGLLIGIISAIVSAPVIVLVFGGATGNGAALVTGFFSKMGNQILQSVIYSGISIEPVDKVLQCLLAVFILRRIPQSLLSAFDTGSLKDNKML